MSDLVGRVSLITGGSRGIGRSVAVALARAGSTIAITAKSARALEATLAELRGLGVRAEGMTADVADAAQIAESVKVLTDALGPVDILVNNAASGGPIAKVWEAPPGEWFDLTRQTLFGTFHYCRHVVPPMIERRWGRIVNVNATSGLQGVPLLSARCAAKHAQIGLARSLALEVAEYGITVNTVCADFTETEASAEGMRTRAAILGISPDEVRARIVATIPQRRFMKPEDIANAVLFLVSSGGGERITGTELRVSGGR